jgi:hypothetical protein
MNSDEEATTFRECLPDHRNVALIVEPTPHHGSLMKRLKETIEAERRQHKLIMEMESESGSGMNLLPKADVSSISFYSYHSEEGQEPQENSIIDTNSGNH